ncbi:DUF4974 domain-containing protein [Pedobacter sp. BS3]|uniref:FecR family protein n=1 Tax=Pedobacter sp. BS3 TaxID=2567937 RepID=UPI0011EF6F6F|nr:FecR family protein [Pedobacter sp. BS3]TZF83162.1 DUF4974 domain-containing protein [Pedobacter sp. BS3]
MDKNKEALEKAGLILKRLQNEPLSPQEEAALDAWLAENPQHAELFDTLQDKRKLQDELRFFSDVDTGAALTKLKNTIKPASARRLNLLKYAATVALFLVAGYAALIVKRKQQQRLAANTYRDIKPGGNRAMLTLSDGSVITLDQQANGLIKQEYNARITKKDGQVLYQLNPAKSSVSVKYNTVTTPTGGEYQVVLPDGTKVWLNAMSSLRFPTSFPGKERIVELTGEAYFEVAKKVEGGKAEGKRVPFIVKANGQQVEVLGTHFNINAYPDEEVIKTTLLEGSVKVSNLKPLQKNAMGQVSNLKSQISNLDDGVRLKPGQQSTYNPVSGNIALKNVDTDEAVAWKNGYFLFNDENIESIMRKIARWYDVDVQYSEGVSSKLTFNGSVSRFEKVSEVLKIMELTDVVHFKIEGRKIMVMK